MSDCLDGFGINLDGVKMQGNFSGYLRIAGVWVVLMAALANAASGQSVVNGALSLVNLRITPGTLVAGENVTISFQLYNSYNSNLNDVAIEITATNPLLNVSPVYTQYVTSIGTGQYGGLGYESMNYTFHIPSTLEAGEYTIDIVGTYSTVAGEGSQQTSEVGTATMPIDLYIYGNPQIQLTAAPSGQITPGGQSTFDISALNSGTDTARNVTVTILNSTNFTAYGTPVLAFGIMSIGDTGSETVVLQTSASLKEGETSVPVLLNYTAQDGRRVSMEERIPLSFVLGAPDIVASIQSAYPQRLYPGSNQTLTILLQNTGYSTAKNLSVAYLSNNGINVQSSTSSFYVGTLGEGESTTQQIFIAASTNVSLASQTIPVRVSYSTLASGTQTTSVQNMPISVQDASLFNVTGTRGTLTPGGSYEPITFVVKNTGSEPAQQVSLALQTVYPLSPTNPDFYVSELLPGESVNATFYVSVDSNAKSGTYPVTLYEQWRQPNGYTTEQYSSSNNYYAAVSAQGAGGSDMWAYAIGAVVVIAAAVVAYRMRTGKKQAARKGRAAT